MGVAAGAGVGAGVVAAGREAVEAVGSMAGVVSTSASCVCVGSSVSAAACVESPISEFIELRRKPSEELRFAS